MLLLLHFVCIFDRDASYDRIVPSTSIIILLAHFHIFLTCLFYSDSQNNESSPHAPQNVLFEVLQAQKNELEKLYQAECALNKELEEKLNRATQMQTQSNMRMNTQQNTSHGVQLRVLFDEIVTR